MHPNDKLLTLNITLHRLADEELNRLYDFAVENKNNPVKVITEIRETCNSKKQINVTLNHLVVRLRRLKPLFIESTTKFGELSIEQNCGSITDVNLENLIQELETERKTVSENIKVVEPTSDKDKFSFSRVRKYLDILKSDTERLLYLYNIKAEFEQLDKNRRTALNQEFPLLCSSEVERLHNIIQLEKVTKKQDEVKRESNFGRKSLIDAYIRASKKTDRKVGEMDLVDELGYSKATLRRVMERCGLGRIRDIKEAAEEHLRKSS